MPRGWDRPVEVTSAAVAEQKTVAKRVLIEARGRGDGIEVSERVHGKLGKTHRCLQQNMMIIMIMMMVMMTMITMM